MTTDTALLVSREILEEQKALASLKFLDDPEIPTDASVKRYLDERLPIQTLVEGKIKIDENKTLT